MKKIISFIVVALSVLAVASCSKENAGAEATMTLKVNIPEAVTKAYGDGMFADKNLIIGVFDENGVEKFRKVYVWSPSKFEDAISIRFMVGKKYQMVFWAQYGEAYGKPETMPLDQITLDYARSNREDLDAFWAHVPVFEVKTDFDMSVTLHRPFAQLNFATTVGDMNESVADPDLAGLHNKAAVTVKNVANTLNLFTGETCYIDANNHSEAAGAAVIIPDTEFPKVKVMQDGKEVEVYPTIQVEGVTYEIVAMNYILVADSGSKDGKTTVDLKLQVGEFELSVPNAYMKRNWRTNVVGELLTAEGSFKVNIDPIFEGTYSPN
jgi:hypothetical protein